jgi:anti-sigma-K factor RskA
LNIEEYISSGILEAYVLGSLSTKEAEEVEAKAALYPGIAKELEELQIAMEHFAMAHAVKPPDISKEKLFQSLDNDSNVSKDTKKERTLILPEEGLKHNNWLVAASISVALISTISSFYFYTKWKGTETQLISLQQENQVFALKANQIINSKEQELNERAKYISFILDTSTARVVMKGLPLSPVSAALVFWNKQSNEVFIDIKKLPIPPAGMQYQLWALNNGTPIDAGVFSTSGNTLQKMKSIDKAQAFAVTLEKAGGSPTPTLEAMYVMGSL